MPGDFLEWSVDSLKPGTRYRYSIRLAGSAGSESIVARGAFITQRAGEESFTAALITDPHTGTFAESSPQVKVMDDVIRNAGRDNPDFAIALGDNVAWVSSRDQPQQSKDGAERAYEMYRRHIGPLVHSCPHFSLLGNWDGETGKFPQASIDLVRAVRHRFLPNPDNATYPQGGSASQDYYAFTWGPALFVVLNVQSYTNASTPLKLPTSADVTRIEDWTLGGAQMSWLDRTLKASGYPFKVLCIHHAVGGDAGNGMDTLYGRGGARAACGRTKDRASAHA
jgi:phosphodiesterase/alkaline phosphatase D-like protein